MALSKTRKAEIAEVVQRYRRERGQKPATAAKDLIADIRDELDRIALHDRTKDQLQEWGAKVAPKLNDAEALMEAVNAGRALDPFLRPKRATKKAPAKRGR